MLTHIIGVCDRINEATGDPCDCQTRDGKCQRQTCVESQLTAEQRALRFRERQAQTEVRWLEQMIGGPK